MSASALFKTAHRKHMDCYDEDDKIFTLNKKRREIPTFQYPWPNANFPFSFNFKLFRYLVHFREGSKNCAGYKKNPILMAFFTR